MWTLELRGDGREALPPAPAHITDPDAQQAEGQTALQLMQADTAKLGKVIQQHDKMTLQACPTLSACR